MRGFTVIELIVVIAVLAVLSAVVLINVFGYVEKSQNAAIISDIEAMEKSGIIYLSEHGSYAGFFDDASYTNPKNAILKI